MCCVNSFEYNYCYTIYDDTRGQNGGQNDLQSGPNTQYLDNKETKRNWKFGPKVGQNATFGEQKDTKIVNKFSTSYDVYTSNKFVKLLVILYDTQNKFYNLV